MAQVVIPNTHKPLVMRAIYASANIDGARELSVVFRYADWLIIGWNTDADPVLWTAVSWHNEVKIKVGDTETGGRMITAKQWLLCDREGVPADEYSDSEPTYHSQNYGEISRSHMTRTIEAEIESHPEVMAARLV